VTDRCPFCQASFQRGPPRFVAFHEGCNSCFKTRSSQLWTLQAALSVREETSTAPPSHASRHNRRVGGSTDTATTFFAQSPILIRPQRDQTVVFECTVRPPLSPNATGIEICVRRSQDSAGPGRGVPISATAYFWESGKEFDEARGEPFLRHRRVRQQKGRPKRRETTI
jgi:hypothetical protein